ncbi:hypothetical protein CLAFUW4_14026 [Fulvia fulva]|nr:hypothetical protein CLAFUR4_14029 [Fulvia fulva]KAK4610786.1 hypothetical protein CLAFUR0_14033 [Fulvia fulva]WPV22217.1 hypothetical protein CLAFUW4_14026 [Fulvia fulva]
MDLATLHDDTIDRTADAWSPSSSSSDDDAFDFFSGESREVAAQTVLVDTSPSASAVQNDGVKDRTWRWLPLQGVDDIHVFCFYDTNAGDSLGAIHGHFRLVRLDEVHEYSALSYAWGPIHADGSHLTHKIVVDCLEFPVTAHLHAALRALQRARQLSPKTSLLSAIWIDAICIDQGNPVERSAQVMLMGRIYSKAARLYVWLGELDSGPVPIETSDVDLLMERSLTLSGSEDISNDAG